MYVHSDYANIGAAGWLSQANALLGKYFCSCVESGRARRNQNWGLIMDSGGRAG